jgi:predicted small integral membrane protein
VTGDKAMEGTSLLSWMAWTWPTAAFFICIFLALVGMSVWEFFVPGGSPRHGILGIDTTRGDRLFISLLGSAFIFLAWLGIAGAQLGVPAGIAIVYAIAVFRWV